MGAAAALALVTSGSARADAAKDVRDIRAGKLPIRYDWLGFDGGARAHFRTLVCSGGGTTSCNASLVVQPPEGPARATKLLSIAEVYCEPSAPCDALDGPTARAFVAAEKTALAAMPPTTKTAAEPLPAALFGQVAGEATQIDVIARDVSRGPDDQPHVQVELVLRGKGGAIETLGVLDRYAYRLEGAKIRDAFVSSDRKAAAIVVETSVGVMCWSFDDLFTVGANVPRRRASLANTIGFRAWKTGDMAAALAAFTEATRSDPTFGLGWYNRAALESRGGDLASAKTSFDAAVAVDPSFARRACADPDFAALRAADPARFACAR